MTALVREHSRLDERWTRHAFPLKAGKKAFKGGVAVLEVSSGAVVPGTTGPGFVFLGLFLETVDNSGGATSTPVNVDFLKEKEIVWLGNDGTITKLGQPTYLLDDQTLTATPVGTPMGPALGLNTGFGVAVEVASIGGGSSISGTSSGTIVYRPGDTSGAANVFTTWAGALAARSEIQGYCVIEFDSSIATCHIPTAGMPGGGWVLPADTSFFGYSGIGASSTVIVDVGATVLGWPVDIRRIFMQSNATGDAFLYSPSGPVCIFLEENTTLEPLGGGTLFHAPNATTVNVLCAGGTVTLFSVSGFVFQGKAGLGTNHFSLVAYDGVISANANSLSTTGGTISARIGSPATTINATQDGTVVSTYLSLAANVSYTPAVSGNWASTAPTLTSQAIDRLAALAVTLNGGTPIP